MKNLFKEIKKKQMEAEKAGTPAHTAYLVCGLVYGYTLGRLLDARNERIEAEREQLYKDNPNLTKR